MLTITPTIEALVSQVASATSLSRVDILALAQIETEEELRAVLRGYQVANAPLDVSTFDKIVEGLRVASDVAGLLLPILAVAPAVRGALAS